jgi:hypothetical protein
MLPTTAPKGRGAARSSPPLFGPYLRRIVKVCKPRGTLGSPQNPNPLRLSCNPSSDRAACRSGVASPRARRDVKLRFSLGFSFLSECGLTGRRIHACVVHRFHFGVEAPAVVCLLLGWVVRMRSFASMS